MPTAGAPQAAGACSPRTRLHPLPLVLLQVHSSAQTAGNTLGQRGVKLQTFTNAAVAKYSLVQSTIR